MGPQEDTMKRLQSLIRLHTWQLEEKRRTLAGLEGLRADFVAQGEKLEKELGNEQRAATASPEYAITYESYAKAVILRRKNLVGSIAETDEQIEVAVTEVQEAHREMRKYEIAEERAQKREQAEEDRVEQADMEEIASTQFRMRSDSRVR
jgi:flagellar export protein FliJ